MKVHICPYFQINHVWARSNILKAGTNRKDKGYRRYASNVERALSLFDTALQEWADYIAFLGRLLKVRCLPIAEDFDLNPSVRHFNPNRLVPPMCHIKRL